MKTYRVILSFVQEGPNCQEALVTVTDRLRALSVDYRVMGATEDGGVCWNVLEDDVDTMYEALKEDEGLLDDEEAE